MRSLENYLVRINVPKEKLIKKSTSLNDNNDVFRNDRANLELIMEAHSRAIAFENLDVVLGKTISMSQSDVETKLVYNLRGGYCFEQNTLLLMVLKEMGFDVMPLLCRVRWNIPDSKEGDGDDEPVTAHTHLALKVKTKEESGSSLTLLADVGFAGLNSIASVNLGIGDQEQELPEGRFHVVPSKYKEYHTLELLVKNEWAPMYEWRDERAPLIEQKCSNWIACTFPKEFFTTVFFVSRVVHDERHHIHNNEYVIRRGFGGEIEVETEVIKDKARLLDLIDTVFGLKLAETDNIDRYL